MKKLLLAAFVLALGFTSMAQSFERPIGVRDINNAKSAAKSATWYMQDNTFTLYDFRDTEQANPLSLADWQDSGYFVVLDFSAAWCGPCWNIHAAGILEGYYDRFGPNGDNTLRVVWVEGDGSNTSAQITGTGNTQGDWTLGGTFPIPMVDDANVMTSCFNTLWQSYQAYPCIILIAPNGVYRSLYGEDDGISYFDTAICNANLANLMANYPHQGAAPVVSLNGPIQVRVGSSASFVADVVDMTGVTDPVTGIEWQIDGNVEATSGTSLSHTFNNTGNHTVTVSVTNVNGTTTKTLNVNVFDWNWGNTMTYCGGDMKTSYGRGGSECIWGAMFPAEFMGGRQYLKNVELYVYVPGTYTLEVYEGGDNAPSNMIYTRTLALNQQSTWNTINVSGAVELSQNQNLWVVLKATATYPMSCSEYCGDENGCWINYQGSWLTFYGMGYEYTWMIKATTGDSPNAGINTVNGAEVNVYPNPATSTVNVEAEGLQSVDVLDMAGRVVMSSSESVVNISDLANGVYMFRVNTVNGTATQKVVKK